ncbi:GmrSD restriction endonuclease domain-containing protein, partial [Desulfosarcina cetonica]|uniref:GmrSD restriction endonuclease domain-containing protein n=1 Tax=Desulfosarcina cetonica TaxID=90730 RepID=UPI000A8BCAC2
NDRGLNLTPSEMLKGFVLSRITEPDRRNEINDIWKTQIQKLHEYGETSDQAFFQAWFRGKYAVSIRPGQAGSENKDFELIGSRFHNWFKDNHRSLFNLKSSNDFYGFFKNQFPFFVKWYIRTCESWNDMDDQIPHLHYIYNWGIADSLQDPLLLSSIKFEDDEETVKNKLDLVARFIETFTVRRAVNYKKFGQTTIKYTMFNLIKLIRNNDLAALGKNLTKAIDDMEHKWDGIQDFGLHGQNRKFVKHLLSRMSSYLDNLVGKTNNYVSYQHPKGRQFEIEHLWADKFDYFKDEFDQESDFQDWRDSIGALVLLPNGTNQSFSSDKYKDKLKHYLKENTYAQTLHPVFYEKNPNFLKAPKIDELKFKAHPEFKKADLEERQELVQRICEQLWSTDYFNQE